MLFSLDRRTLLQALLGGAVVTAVTGCGQKGPLYLPEESEPGEEDDSQSSTRPAAGQPAA